MGAERQARLDELDAALVARMGEWDELAQTVELRRERAEPRPCRAGRGSTGGRAETPGSGDHDLAQAREDQAGQAADAVVRRTTGRGRGMGGGTGRDRL